MEIDFGCILNDTEVTRYVNVTNHSPMDVTYRWSFLIDDEPVTKFQRPPTVAAEEEPLALEDMEEDRENEEVDKCRSEIQESRGEQSQLDEIDEEQNGEEEAREIEREEEMVDVEIQLVSGTPSGTGAPNGELKRHPTPVSH